MKQRMDIRHNANSFLHMIKKVSGVSVVWVSKGGMKGRRRIELLRLAATPIGVPKNVIS
jgi:hypothetical protein